MTSFCIAFRDNTNFNWKDLELCTLEGTKAHSQRISHLPITFCINCIRLMVTHDTQEEYMNFYGVWCERTLAE